MRFDGVFKSYFDMTQTGPLQPWNTYPKADIRSVIGEALWLMARMGADSTGRCTTPAEHLSGCVEAKISSQYVLGKRELASDGLLEHIIDELKKCRICLTYSLRIWPNTICEPR